MEVRFRLNSKNEKDKVIIDFLNSQYNHKEFIKAVIYNLAMVDDGASTIDNYGAINREKNNSLMPIMVNEGESTSNLGLIINEEFKDFFK